MSKLMTIDDLADTLAIPKGTLYQWRTRGYGPRGIRVGKHVRYRPDDVNAWIDQQAVA